MTATPTLTKAVLIGQIGPKDWSMADLDAMATFVAVVRMGGFRGAATSMHIPRSTVSQRVARLEEQLGVRLLERTTRKLRMTDVARLTSTGACASLPTSKKPTFR